MLYIMRHGQTDWNITHRLQGQTDIPLNDHGKDMAVSAGEKYAGLALDICYCSPLQRARETAEIFLKGREIPIISDDRLREMSFGKYEGLEGIMEMPEHPMYGLFHEPERYVASGGAEPLERLFERTGRFLCEAVKPKLEEGKHILIVGHGAMNLSIINRILEVPLQDFWKRLPGNCELVTFREDCLKNL